MTKPYAMLGVVFAALVVSSTPGISQLVSQVPARESPSLLLTAKIPLTGVSGRIDHFTFDPKRRLTIFSGLGNSFGDDSDTDNLRYDEASKRVLSALWAASR